MNRYTKMYGWLYTTFGTKTFSLDDFRMNFPSPQPTKTVHDLIQLHFIKRVKRGKYQIIRPQEFVNKIVQENLMKETILEKAKRTYVYSDSTAVNIWTDGYYWTDFTKGFKPIHITILKKDIDYWNEFFKSNNVEYVFDGEDKTLFGLTYVVHPVDRIKTELKKGIPIVPLEETVKFCQNNNITYRPALEYLDKKYRLHLVQKYEQVRS